MINKLVRINNLNFLLLSSRFKELAKKIRLNEFRESTSLLIQLKITSIQIMHDPYD